MWNRKHIEFIRYDSVAWQALEVDGLPSGLHLRTFSIDHEVGALSGILDIPAGWECPFEFTSSAPEQMFILKGDLQVGEDKLTEQFFSYRPAGARHGQMRSENGCQAIVMWDDAFRIQPEQTGNDDGIILIDTIKTHWEPTVATGPAAGIKVKKLREDSASGEMTFILGIMPNWFEPRAEHHPCVEESFKIFGDMNLNMNLGDKMVMGEDCYFYRPPWIKHGPLYTRTGTMSLVRVSSTLVNRYMPLDEDEEYLALAKKPVKAAA
jgi:hypothetical protein